ncbi:hypothetical protein [Pseudomonas sp. D(2018)]|uniref:hypothetical protein n=1 Tax=Pseudomonas sp. D(2018) TaxID=2502238 RepID=UPI0010F45141|nr:hypothetical protein [Pseudomonas sp. D(2018)]
MKLISDGYGDPRYTLYIPLVMHRLSRPIDLPLLANELGKKLSVGVTISPGSGWEQLRMGPFAAEALANEAFHRTIRYLVALCVQCQYPIFFDQHLAQLIEPAMPMVIFPESPVDALANLACPVIIPEHRHVYDTGVLLGNVDPQLASHQLIDALGSASDLRGPLPARVRLAVEAYIVACATHAPMMKFVGFVICLESLCEQETRPSNELAALHTIRTAIENSDVAENDAVHAEMADLVLDTIRNIRHFSISTQFRKLIMAHAAGITAELGQGHPWLKDMKKAARTIYKMRSKIVHEGKWGAEYETVGMAMNFVKAAAKAVVLGLINGPSAKVSSVD